MILLQFDCLANNNNNNNLYGSRASPHRDAKKRTRDQRKRTRDEMRAQISFRFSGLFFLRSIRRFQLFFFFVYFVCVYVTVCMWMRIKRMAYNTAMRNSWAISIDIRIHHVVLCMFSCFVTHRHKKKFSLVHESHQFASFSSSSFRSIFILSRWRKTKKIFRCNNAVEWQNRRQIYFHIQKKKKKTTKQNKNYKSNIRFCWRFVSFLFLNSFSHRNDTLTQPRS